MKARETYPREIQNYLTQLDLESEALPAHQRRTLRSQIEGHIEEAWTPDSSGPSISEILASLGNPRTLVREELAQGGQSDVRPNNQLLTAFLYVLAVIGAIWAVGSIILLVAAAISGAFPGWTIIAATAGVLLGGTAVVVAIRQLRKRRR